MKQPDYAEDDAEASRSDGGGRYAVAATVVS